jgi:exo-beta-1,3-glucanase (GH17 family)
MSNPYMRRLSLSGLDLSTHSVDELKALVGDVLRNRIHGISFSPYLEGQGPGERISDGQIRDRLATIAPSVRWVRTFSCTEGHELIPAIANEHGLQTMVGVWLDDDTERNELELANAIDIARAGLAGILAVGNEVLLRGELSEDALIEYIDRAKRACPDTPVGYVDAYFKFSDHPRVAEACDVVLANCYPFWEGCPAEHALLYMKEMYRTAQRAANGTSGPRKTVSRSSISPHSTKRGKSTRKVTLALTGGSGTRTVNPSLLNNLTALSKTLVILVRPCGRVT